MRVTKCDRCKREIRDHNDEVSLSVGVFELYGCHLHRRCAQPIIHFLKRHGLVKERPPAAA